MPQIGNIKIKGTKKGKPKLTTGEYVLPFAQTEKSLKNLEYKNRFIKSVESLVRTNIRYTRYKAYLMTEKGLDFCQIHPNITSDNGKVPIEMHHGPILTLYDYCTIVTNALIEREYDNITTFTVAKIILEEHRLNNVQVVMLCENCHDLFHAGGIYINPKQAWGNLKKFLEKWNDGIDRDMRNIINNNLKIAKEYESNDNGMLEARAGKVWKR